jgi:hypothetical protein
MLDIDEAARKIADEASSFARDQKIDVPAYESFLLAAGSERWLNERGVAELEKAVSKIYRTDDWIVENRQGGEPESLPPLSARDEAIKQQAIEIGYHRLTNDPTAVVLMSGALDGLLNERAAVQFDKLYADVKHYDAFTIVEPPTNYRSAPADQSGDDHTLR